MCKSGGPLLAMWLEPCEVIQMEVVVKCLIVSSHSIQTGKSLGGGTGWAAYEADVL